MRKGKLVHLICDEPIALDPNAEQPWSDVWVKTSLGKKKWLHLGPTIEGTADIERELQFERDFRASHPEWDDGGEQERLLAEALAAAKRGEHYFVPSPEHGTPTISVPHRMVTREIAEKAIAAYLDRFHGIHRCRFKWQKPRVLVCPA